MDDGQGGTMLCAAISDLTAQLRQTLWRPQRPVVLASGTLAVGKDFRRFKEETGLLTDSRVTESVALSPFDYERNCLLYLPQCPPSLKDTNYYHQLSGEIAALNEYGAIRAEIKAEVLELTELARAGGEGDGTSLPELRRRLDELLAEQARLVDDILKNMDDPELNARLKTLAEEKQDILNKIAACQQDEEQRAVHASRQREMEEWLDQQPLQFTEYEDTLVRKFLERITVVDAETIQVKIRETDIEIKQQLR
jgi:hypothetical protein